MRLSFLESDFKTSTTASEDLSNRQEWMRYPSIDGVFLIERDLNVWAEGKDLIAVRAKQSNKVFRLLADTFTPICYYTFGKYHKVS